MQRFEVLAKGVARPLGIDLDATGGEVSDEAREAERAGAVLGEEAEPNALNPALHDGNEASPFRMGLIRPRRHGGLR